MEGGVVALKVCTQQGSVQGEIHTHTHTQAHMGSACFITNELKQCSENMILLTC